MEAGKHFFTVLARSKDEPHVQEWVQHYTEEGADRIIIIDDASEDLSVYEDWRVMCRSCILPEDSAQTNSTPQD